MSRGEAGYSLVALVATVTIMLLVMSASVPAWRYVVKSEKEEELIFRGGQIADAIERYQKKNGSAPPASIDALVKGRFLRRAYKDPMTKDGKWRFVRQGEGMGTAPAGTVSPSPGVATPSPSPTPTPSGSPGLPGASGTLGGAFIGVASTSTEGALRVFNGKTHYNEWIFAAGQPRVVGKTNVAIQGPIVAPGAATPPPALPGGSGPGANPPASPSPR